MAAVTSRSICAINILTRRSQTPLNKLGIPGPFVNSSSGIWFTPTIRRWLPGWDLHREYGARLVTNIRGGPYLEPYACETLPRHDSCLRPWLFRVRLGVAMHPRTFVRSVSSLPGERVSAIVSRRKLATYTHKAPDWNHRKFANCVLETCTSSLPGQLVARRTGESNYSGV